MSLKNIPTNWCVSTIGDVNNYNSLTFNPKSFQEDTFELYSVPSFASGSPEVLLGKDIASKKQYIKFKDILLCKINPRINRVWCVKENTEFPQIGSSEWIVIRQPLIHEYFLTYFLQTQSFRDLLCSDVSGVGGSLTRAQPKRVATYHVPIAPFQEQKIIAEKLDTLLTQVGCTKARLEQILPILKHFRRATLTMAIKGDLTKNWRVENNIINAWTNQKASDLCIKVQSGSTPTGNPFEQNGKIPFLKVYNIVNQKIDFDYKPQFITDEVHRSKSKRSIAFPDDILMNIVGPPLGKIAILTDQYPEWNLNQAITLFRVDKEKLSSKFLYYVLCEGKLVRDVMHDTKGIVGQINISLTQCREAIIPCPSLLEQHEIVRRVEQLFAYADTIEKQVNSALTRVNSLTQSILAKAFRGELTAQWRAENPDLISGENSAAALLEKIKAERAASSGKKASRKKA